MAVVERSVNGRTKTEKKIALASQFRTLYGSATINTVLGKQCMEKGISKLFDTSTKL